MEKKFYIKTYGCQMNDLDGQQMGRLLKNQGYLATLHPEEADVILVNTCSIREKASQKVYSDVGRFRSLKLNRPDLVLGVTGCQAQAEGPHLLKRFPYLDLVLGPDHLASLPQLIAEVQKKSQARIAKVGFEKREDYQFLHLLPDQEENQVKAFLTIMKGCDNFCSFCIVPYVRGREVCREPDDIVCEVRELAEQGVREVTLLGQNVNSYGVGRHANPPFISFAKLLGRIAEETDIQRIRFTTSHPKDLPDELLEAFVKYPKIARHFHLPVQSGSNSTLQRMYRGYTVEEFLDKLAGYTKADPSISFSTDIIVGFPGETDQEFEATLDLLRRVRFDSIYSFFYSPRPKTTAALYFEDNIPLPEKQERLREIQRLQDEITYEKNRHRVGETLQVLVEGPSKQGDSYCGRSSQNHKVHYRGSEEDIGKIIDLTITHGGPNSLRGERYGRN